MSKTKKTIRLLMCMVFAVVMLSLTACNGVQIDVYESQDDDYYNFEIEIGIDAGMVRALETSATYQSVQQKWTIENWLREYFDVCGSYYGFAHRYYGSSENGTVYTFFVNVPKANAKEELTSGLSFDETAKQSIKHNLFLYTVDVVREDRFNHWVRTFDDVYGRYAAADETERKNPVLGNDSDAFRANCQSLMGGILFGFVEICADLEPADVYGQEEYWTDESGNVYRKSLPGVAEAFPAADLHTYTDVLLRNFWYASKHVNANESARVRAVDDDGATDTYGVFYLFEKKAGDGDTYVEYSYYRAYPTGWYLVAIAGGGFTVGVAYLIAYLLKRKKEKKPPQKVEDFFPYDPFA